MFFMVRVTRHSEWAFNTGTDISLGSLDDATGLVLEREIFADQQPDCWRLSGDHLRMSRAETLTKYGVQVDNA